MTPAERASDRTDTERLDWLIATATAEMILREKPDTLVGAAVVRITRERIDRAMAIPPDKKATP